MALRLARRIHRGLQLYPAVMICFTAMGCNWNKHILGGSRGLFRLCLKHVQRALQKGKPGWMMKMSDGIGEAGDFVDLVQRGFYDGPGALVYWGAVGPMGAFWVLRVGENQFHPFWLIVADLLSTNSAFASLFILLYYIVLVFVMMHDVDPPSVTSLHSSGCPFSVQMALLFSWQSLASSGCA